MPQTPEQIRASNLEYLKANGFKAAEWMPLPPQVDQPAEDDGFSGGILRPANEIATRLLCHCAVFSWGQAPAEYEHPITQFIENNSLRSHMTGEEIGILDMSKQDAIEKWAHSIGWRLENMWSLAWLIGHAEKPSAITGQLPDEVTGKLMGLFLPSFDVTVEGMLADTKLVSNEEALKTEDLFYLAHNAVRSGQVGSLECLPEGFDPISDGGAIHERRHSLTWALSPGVSWDETDLST